MQIKNHTKNFLIELERTIQLRHTEYKKQNLQLDLTRGKPAPEQLELSLSLIHISEPTRPL